MSFRISDLKNFIETAHCSTMSEAARKLEITQPALSESIKRLEEDLGEVLFYRSRSGISLTSTGESVLEKAKIAMSSLLDVESFKAGDSSFKGRFITIGCHPVVGSYFLPRALKALEKKAPDYRVDLKHGLSRVIQAEIQKGLIDIGIVINPIFVPDLIVKKVSQDNVCLWSSKKGPIGNKLICNLDLFQTQSILRKWKEAPADIINTDSLELIVRLVANQVGYGIIPERAVHLFNADFKKHKDTPSFKDDICLVYRPEFGKNEFEQAVIESLKSAMV